MWSNDNLYSYMEKKNICTSGDRYYLVYISVLKWWCFQQPFPKSAIFIFTFSVRRGLLSLPIGLSCFLFSFKAFSSNFYFLINSLSSYSFFSFYFYSIVLNTKPFFFLFLIFLAILRFYFLFHPSGNLKVPSS